MTFTAVQCASVNLPRKTNTDMVPGREGGRGEREEKRGKSRKNILMEDVGSKYQIYNYFFTTTMQNCGLENCVSMCTLFCCFTLLYMLVRRIKKMIRDNESRCTKIIRVEGIRWDYYQYVQLASV